MALKGNMKPSAVTLAITVVISLVAFSAYELSAGLSAESLTRKGVAAFEAGDAEAAERQFVAAVKRAPKHTAAWLNLGTAAEKLQKYVMAAEAYEKVLSLTSNEDMQKTAKYRLAVVYGVKSDPATRHPEWPDKAVEHLEQLLLREPDNPEYYMQLGFASFNAVDPGKGLKALETASELARGSEHLWIHLELMDFYTRANLASRAKNEKQIINSLSAGGGNTGISAAKES